MKLWKQILQLTHPTKAAKQYTVFPIQPKPQKANDYIYDSSLLSFWIPLPVYGSVIALKTTGKEEFRERSSWTKRHYKAVSVDESLLALFEMKWKFWCFHLVVLEWCSFDDPAAMQEARIFLWVIYFIWPTAWLGDKGRPAFKCKVFFITCTCHIFNGSTTHTFFWLPMGVGCLIPFKYYGNHKQPMKKNEKRITCKERIITNKIMISKVKFRTFT